MSTSRQRSDHITLVRQSVTALLNAVDDLHSLKREWDSLDLGNEIVSGDFTGENEGLTEAQIAAIYTTLAAVDGLLAQGHATNLYAVSQ